MKAVRYHGNGELRVEQLPDPHPGPADVLLAPVAVGVCGTDNHIVGGHFVSCPPVVLGHEVAAEVLEVGKKVRGLEVGQLITVEPHLYCGACTPCQTGRQHLCPHRRAPGVHIDGGMAERLVVPATLAYPVPSGVPAEHAAMTEPIACCIHGMDRLAPSSGLPLAVFGCGPAGAIMIALARLSGAAPIVAFDPQPRRRELALRVGADVALDPTDVDVAEQVAELTGGDGFAASIDAVGSARVLEQAVNLSARGGRILVFGVADASERASISPNEVYMRELSILGTALNPYTHRRAVGLLQRLPLDQLRTGAFGLDDVPAALEAQRRGEADKVFIRPQRNGTVR